MTEVFGLIYNIIKPSRVLAMCIVETCVIVYFINKYFNKITPHSLIRHYIKLRYIIPFYSILSIKPLHQFVVIDKYIKSHEYFYIGLIVSYLGLVSLILQTLPCGLLQVRFLRKWLSLSLIAIYWVLFYVQLKCA